MGRERTPNARLRAVRENERRESRREFAAALASKAAELGENVGVDARLIAKWEDGDTGRPRPVYRRLLVALTGRTEDDLGVGPAGPDRAPEPAPAPEVLVPVPAATPPAYVDPALVGYFREQLHGHYRADMMLGPHHLLATVTAQHRLICDLAAGAEPELRRELLRVGAAYAAMLGWLYQDAGEHEQSVRWRDVTLDMAHRARDRQLVGYALANKASLCVDIGDGPGAVDLAGAAMYDRSALAPKVRVIAAVHAAHGHSVLGNRRAVDDLLGGAEREVARIDDAMPWGDACRRTPGYLDVQRATCYGRLPGPAAAQAADALWSRVLAGVPGSQRRDVAVFRARHAAAAAAVGEPDRAVALAQDAAAMATATGSVRARGELAVLRERMRPWAGDRHGRDLADVLATIGVRPT